LTWGPLYKLTFGLLNKSNAREFPHLLNIV